MTLPENLEIFRGPKNMINKILRGETDKNKTMQLLHYVLAGSSSSDRLLATKLTEKANGRHEKWRLGKDTSKGDPDTQMNEDIIEPFSIESQIRLHWALFSTMLQLIESPFESIARLSKVMMRILRQRLNGPHELISRLRIWVVRPSCKRIKWICVGLEQLMLRIR